MVSLANGRGKTSKFAANLESGISLAVRGDLYKHQTQFPDDTQADICTSIDEDYGRFNAALNGHSKWALLVVAKLARGGFPGALQALCRACGYMAVAMPKVGHGGMGALAKALGKMLKEVHEAIEECVVASTAEVLLESKRDRCIREIDEAIASLDVCRQRLLEAPVQREIEHV